MVPISLITLEFWQSLPHSLLFCVPLSECYLPGALYGSSSVHRLIPVHQKRFKTALHSEEPCE